jgi:diaminohydroxyphosphoribosylaminopyrimidine deaminase/5-amino-6-(5-phosphoribosylamino)uracil reductase
VARALAGRGITSLLVEGGATVAAEALRARMVDRVVLFMAPAILGGDAVPAVGSLGLRRVADALRLDVLAVGRSGPDLVIEARVRSPRA